MRNKSMAHRFAAICAAVCLAGMHAAIAQDKAVPARPAPFKPDAAPARPEAVPYAPVRPPSAQSGNAGKKFGDDMDCMVEPHIVASLGSPVEGTLSEVLVDRGALVSRGQVVARLHSKVEEAT